VVIPRLSRKRWQVEVFRKPRKFDANSAKSSTYTVNTQINLVLLSICAAFKLGCLGVRNRLSPLFSVPQTAHPCVTFCLCRTPIYFGSLRIII
jgi:hypothetical protein